MGSMGTDRAHISRVLFKLHFEISFITSFLKNKTKHYKIQTLHCSQLLSKVLQTKQSGVLSSSLIFSLQKFIAVLKSFPQ